MSENVSPEILFEVKKLSEQSEYFSSIMQVMGFGSIGFSLTASFVIVNYSTHQMGTYKWYLLNNVLCSFTMDLYTCLCYEPMLMLPALGFCAGQKSIFKSFNGYAAIAVQFVIFGVVFCSVCVSGVFICVYRYFSVTNQVHIMHKPKYLLFMFSLQLFLALIPMSFLLYAYFDNPDYVVEELKIRWPHIYIYSLTHNCAFVSASANYNAVLAFLIITVGFIFIGVIIAVSLIIMTLKAIQNRKKHMTVKTYKFQQNLILAFSVQFTIPIVVIVTPAVTCFLVYAFGQTSSKLAKISCSYVFVFLSLHSMLNTICLISLTKPYRNAITTQFLQFKFFKKLQQYNDRFKSVSAI